MPNISKGRQATNIMKSILIAFLLIAAVGCSRQKRSVAYNELVDDFNQMLSKGSLHMAAGNLDSAMYYSGQMHYNLELRDRIVNK